MKNMINLLSEQIEMVVFMSKRTKKIFAWGMLLVMVASVVAGVLAYAL